MSRVRAIDVNGDWTFGKGQNDYLKDNAAVVQSIGTRLKSFLGDCFFDSGAGIDWFNLLGGKDELSLRLSVSSVILNTKDVTGILQLSVNLDAKSRRLTVTYQVQTTFSRASGIFRFDLNGSI